ncbi:unnamed protein product [Parnassius mnemosyne]|uniref:Uncharacterized protein n=1 Tax=Parnassius mnemosyne TaxID=213953 RepID=A0AAV1KJE6_9NEOP
MCVQPTTHIQACIRASNVVGAANVAPRQRARARAEPLRGRRVARLVRVLRGARGLRPLLPQRVARHGLPRVAPPALAGLAQAQVSRAFSFIYNHYVNNIIKFKRLLLTCLKKNCRKFSNIKNCTPDCAF